MQKSMQGTSQFVAFQASMQQSMCGVSQKIPIENASTVNKMERERDLQQYKKIKGNKSIKEVDEGDQQNQFLNVGKWNKSKQSDVKKGNQSISLHTKQRKQSQIANRKSIESPKQDVTKWQKRKSIDSSNKSGTSRTSQNKIGCNHQKCNHQHKAQTQTHVRKQSFSGKVQEPVEDLEEEKQNEENEQEDGAEQEDEEDEEEEQQEQQEQQEQEQQQQQQEQDEDEDEEDVGDDNQQKDQVEEQEPQEQEEQVEDKFATGATNDQFEQSSQALKTETVNTSALNKTPITSKWNKKKAPLDTMTKYQTKETQDNGGKKFHSRLNSANIIAQQDEINEDIRPENAEEWNRVQKILLRLKLLLT